MSHRRALKRLENLREKRRDLAAAELARGERDLHNARRDETAAQHGIEQFGNEAATRLYGVRDPNRLMEIADEWAEHQRVVVETAQATAREQTQCATLRTTLQTKERALRQTEKLLENDLRQRNEAIARHEQRAADDRTVTHGIFGQGGRR